jgi:hypothetical protein
MVPVARGAFSGRLSENGTIRDRPLPQRWRELPGFQLRAITNLYQHLKASLKPVAMPADTIVNVPDAVRLLLKNTYKTSYRRGCSWLLQLMVPGGMSITRGAGTLVIPIQS